MKLIFNLVLCVFSELLNPNPDKKAMKALSQKVVVHHPSLVLRGCGKEDSSYYLYFQTEVAMEQSSALRLAEGLLATLEGEGIDFSKPFDCSIIFKETSDGEYYQIRLQKAGCQVKHLP